jgi:hypothetical protein
MTWLMQQQRQLESLVRSALALSILKQKEKSICRLTPKPPDKVADLKWEISKS